MTYEEALEPNEVLKKIFRGQNYRPYRLPIYKVIAGPRDMSKINDFINVYRQKEDWENAIIPYKTEELQTILLFKDPINGIILYTTFDEFISTNRIHINWGSDI